MFEQIKRQASRYPTHVKTFKRTRKVQKAIFKECKELSGILKTKSRFKQLEFYRIFHMSLTFLLMVNTSIL